MFSEIFYIIEAQMSNETLYIIKTQKNTSFEYGFIV